MIIINNWQYNVPCFFFKRMGMPWHFINQTSTFLTLVSSKWIQLITEESVCCSIFLLIFLTPSGYQLEVRRSNLLWNLFSFSISFYFCKIAKRIKINNHCLICQIKETGFQASIINLMKTNSPEMSRHDNICTNYVHLYSQYIRTLVTD